MKAIILIVSMVLLVTIAATEPQISLENNIDRPGMNYKNYYTSSADPQACATDCANDPNCKAFTFVKPGFRGANSQAECWLKNGVPNPVSSNYCISGVKTDAMPGSSVNQPPSSTCGIKLEDNVDRPGMNYKNYYPSSADPQVCATDCANDPNCKAFTYVKPGFRGANSQAECWLKDGVPDPVPQEYCVSGVKSVSESARSAFSGPSPSDNDIYSSIPGLVLHLWNNMNQPDPKLDSTRKDLIFLDGGDLSAPRDCGYYWWMVPDQDVNPITWSGQLPPGLVLGLRHSSNQESDGRITVGGQNPVRGPNMYGGLVKQDGGDIGGSEGEGFYWYETYNLNFQNWDDAEKYLPKGTVLGLKHSTNQRDKKVYWRGQEYDPYMSIAYGAASPPTFAPRNGGDQGGVIGEGYFWYEKTTGPDYFQSGPVKVNTICGHEAIFT